MLYLAIETTSIPLYILAGFLTGDDKSTESGFKYLLFGALTSAVLLYGFSLIYGFAGTTSLYDLGIHFSHFDLLAVGITFLVLAGLAFKVSLFPFHFWAPDVYEGAPTPVAGFLSTASKAAGFAVILRLLTAVFPVISADWSMILAVLATLTMTVGNLIALAQKNVKRLLAYSSIAHAGYAMIGVVAFSQLGIASAVFYLIAYILTNLLAFGIVGIVGHVTGSDDVSAYNGLGRRNAIPFAGCAGGISFTGRDAAVWWICRQVLRLCCGYSKWLDLAGGGGCLEFDRRVVLLLEHSKIHLPVPDGESGRGPTPGPGIPTRGNRADCPGYRRSCCLARFSDPGLALPTMPRSICSRRYENPHDIIPPP